jgi:hypothetical protein
VYVCVVRERKRYAQEKAAKFLEQKSIERYPFFVLHTQEDEIG